jgi:hypothetical protein
MKTKSCLVAVSAAGAFLASPALPAAAPAYVVGTWSDEAIHLLDAGLNDLGSFPARGSSPNGLAALGSTVWSVTFTDQTVRAFDLSGTLLYSWSHPLLLNAQGLDCLDGGRLLVFTFTSGVPSLVTYDAVTGLQLGLTPLASGTASTEGLAVEGDDVWRIQDADIYLTNIATGADLLAIPNAAAGSPFEGTGIANITPTTLLLVAPDGAWWEVLKSDGSVVTSGNNGLDMYGLATLTPAGVTPVIPEASTALAGAVLAAFGGFVLRRRRA